MSAISSLGNAGMSAMNGMASMMRMRPPPGGDFAQQASATGSAGQTTGQTNASSGRQGPPPPPPMDFNMSLSTTQFAQSSTTSASGTDSDGDGAISKDEFSYDGAGDMGQKLFDSIDSDSDGSLNSDEVSAYQDMMSQVMQQMMGGMMGAGGPPPGPPPAGGPGGGEDPIASLDNDGDGAVSSTEFGITSDSSDDMKALFSAIDSDQDGSLSDSEISSFRDKMTSAMDAQGAQPSKPPAGEGSQDVSAFLQQLAQRYASLSSSTSDSSLSVVA